MSALSPVTTAALIGAPVTGLGRAAAIASTIDAATCTVSASCGRMAPPQSAWSCSASGSSRAGDCASMTCMSEKWPR